MVGRVMETLAMLEGEIAALACKTAHEPIDPAVPAQKLADNGLRTDAKLAPIETESAAKAAAAP
jgi:hypothetical protein